MPEIKIDGPDVIVLPIEEIISRNFTVIPREVLIKGYCDKIGKEIDYFGKKRKIKSVKITEEIIEVELEKDGIIHE